MTSAIPATACRMLASLARSLCVAIAILGTTHLALSQETSPSAKKQSATASAPAAGSQPDTGTTTAEHTVYEISRLRSYDDERLPAALIIAGAIALAAVVWQLYRRDAIELARGTRIGIMFLRGLALLGLFIFFLDIERRTTREVVHNSQVAVLVDVSQSMGLSENESSTDPAASRVKRFVEALQKSSLIDELRQTHDVSVARFDQEVEPVVTLPKYQ